MHRYLIVALALAALLGMAGCGAAGSGPLTLNAEAESSWDNMVWDEGHWAP